MYAKSPTSGAYISSYLLATSMAVTPASCSLRRDTGWTWNVRSARRTVVHFRFKKWTPRRYQDCAVYWFARKSGIFLITVYTTGNIPTVSGTAFQRRFESLLYTNNTACAQESFEPRVVWKFLELKLFGLEKICVMCLLKQRHYWKLNTIYGSLKILCSPIQCWEGQ